MPRRKTHLEFVEQSNITHNNKYSYPEKYINARTDRHCKIYIDNSYIKPDGFDPDTNTIYEFYGDYYHGNPNVYKPELINHKNKKTFGELYKKH